MEGVTSDPNSCTRGAVYAEKKARPQEQQLNCPRCNSTNTKFCYYNNYSLTQPRYFCKTCRRYWTEGGSLRNVPVGGGSRKNKKVTTTASSQVVPDLNPPLPTLSSSQNVKHMQQGGGGVHDLNLAFPIPAMSPYNSAPNNSAPPTSLSAMLNPYVPYSLMPGGTSNSNALYSHGFDPMQLQEVKPNLVGFSVDGLENRPYGVQENNNIGGGANERLLFPFGDMKQLSAADHHIEVEHSTREQGNSTGGYWTGMIGGGSSW